MVITGGVDGDVIAVSDRALLGPRARVGGDLRYGDERPVLAPGARVAGTIGKEDWADTATGWGWVSSLAWWLAVSVSTLLVGVLLVWLAPRAPYAAERAVREHLGATIAWGLGIAIGAPLLAVLALVTLVGIPFGIALLLAAIPVLLIAYTTSAWMLGSRVLRARSGSPWTALLAGWGILRLLALIPVAGGLVGLVATVIGLGALTVALWRARRPRPAEAPAGAVRPSRDLFRSAAVGQSTDGANRRRSHHSPYPARGRRPLAARASLTWPAIKTATLSRSRALAFPRWNRYASGSRRRCARR